MTKGAKEYRLNKGSSEMERFTISKRKRLDNLARSSLTPRFLLLIKLAISLDPSRSLYSLVPLVLALFSQRLLVASDALHMLLRRV